MITVIEAIKIQELLIEKFGGTKEIRDRGLLESAISRPFQTFDNKDLYPEPIQKASAIIESLIKNHLFIDGNKRLGYVLMRLTLLENRIDIEASQDDKYEFVMDIASGKMNFENICIWIQKHIK